MVHNPGGHCYWEGGTTQTISITEDGQASKHIDSQGFIDVKGAFGDHGACMLIRFAKWKTLDIDTLTMYP